MENTGPVPIRSKPEFGFARFSFRGTEPRDTERENYKSEVSEFRSVAEVKTAMSLSHFQFPLFLIHFISILLCKINEFLIHH